MHERRVFVDERAPEGQALIVRGREAHYLLRVLRLGRGAEVTAFDGRGWSGKAAVERTGRGFAELTITSARVAPAPRHTFAVAQAVLKNPAMDAVVHACTELGACAIAGFEAGRSVPRTGGSSAERKIARWRAIAIEACRQCRRDFVPEISLFSGVRALEPLVRESSGALVALLSEESRPLGEMLRSGPFREGARLLLIVGPEGDFAPEELDALALFGAVPCRLSDAVLRASTAAIAGAALLAHRPMTKGTA